MVPCSLHVAVLVQVLCSWRGRPRLRLGMPTKTKTKHSDVEPWAGYVRCTMCGADGKSCLNKYGGHEAWCFRAQGWVSTKAFWYCPECVPKAEEKEWVRTRTDKDTEDIDANCFCEPREHAPRVCPACFCPNWAWRVVCRNRDCRQKLPERVG